MIFLTIFSNADILLYVLGSNKAEQTLPEHLSFESLALFSLPPIFSIIIGVQESRIIRVDRNPIPRTVLACSMVVFGTTDGARLNIISSVKSSRF